MKHTISTTVKIKHEYTEELICDVCGNIIADTNRPNAIYWKSDYYTDEYHERLHLCSIDCLKAKFNEYCDKCLGMPMEHFHKLYFEQDRQFINTDMINKLKKEKDND